MQTKLHINISQGIIDIEGESDLVREIYLDFKDKLLIQLENPSGKTTPPVADRGANPESTKRKRHASPRKKEKPEAEERSIDADNPKPDKSLETSQLADFYGKFEPKNNGEKILVFAKFLTEELGIKSPNTDQFYTCYWALKEKIPKAFAQAFRDTSGRSYGYIDYKSPSDIKITIMGANHFNSGIKRKAPE